jgi:hypothetical protein
MQSVIRPTTGDGGRRAIMEDDLEIGREYTPNTVWTD